jgi:hypothetical protein
MCALMSIINRAALFACLCRLSIQALKLRQCAVARSSHEAMASLQADVLVGSPGIHKACSMHGSNWASNVCPWMWFAEEQIILAWEVPYMQHPFLIYYRWLPIGVASCT